MLSKVVNLIEDPDSPGDLLLDLEGIAEELGWEIGDTLQWTNNQNGTFTLKKVDNEQ